MQVVSNIKEKAQLYSPPVSCLRAEKTHIHKHIFPARYHRACSPLQEKKVIFPLKDSRVREKILRVRRAWKKEPYLLRYRKV